MSSSFQKCSRWLICHPALQCAPKEAAKEEPALSQRHPSVSCVRVQESKHTQSPRGFVGSVFNYLISCIHFQVGSPRSVGILCLWTASWDMSLQSKGLPSSWSCCFSAGIIRSCCHVDNNLIIAMNYLLRRKKNIYITYIYTFSVYILEEVFFSSLSHLWDNFFPHLCFCTYPLSPSLTATVNKTGSSSTPRSVSQRRGILRA